MSTRQQKADSTEGEFGGVVWSKNRLFVEECTVCRASHRAEISALFDNRCTFNFKKGE